jgi:hypothetical protein
MAETKTQPTKASVKAFIAKVENATRRKDAETLLELFERVTGWKAQMWGPTIIGFGRYSYEYESGHAGEMCVCGFSPRKSNLVLYAGGGEKRAALLAKLGKHKANVGCIYVNKLADIDLPTLEMLIKTGIADVKKKWPVSAA